MPLRVLGLGFGRTGTLSLKLALERLGVGPCAHMVDLFHDGDRVARWLEAARRKQAGEPIAWDGLFAGYRATVDWPGVFFWRELLVAFPQAQVVLTVRDPDRWYASAGDTILRLNQPAGPDGRPLPLAPSVVERRTRLDPLLRAVLFDGTFGGRAVDRAHAIATFEAHNAAVRAAVPPDRLLVFDVAQGWGPLCRFLGTPVPAGPFPRVNDTAAFRAGASLAASRGVEESRGRGVEESRRSSASRQAPSS
jgi:hypothetical protein